MQVGPAAFSKAASDTYRNMGDEEKSMLGDSVIKESEKTMTIRGIKKEGSKLFHKIEQHVHIIYYSCVSNFSTCVNILVFR